MTVSRLNGCEDDSLRLTFDGGIRYREDHLSLSSGDRGRRLLQDGKILMEIKFSGSMPVWLSRELAVLNILPVSYSKYGACYQNFLLPDSICVGGIICA